MRKICVFAGAAVLAGLLSMGVPASAEPSGKCGGAPAATGTDGANSVSICTAGVGALTASQQGDGGYVVADGDSGNQATHPCLDGWAGIQVAGGMPGATANSNGDYTYPQPSSGAPGDPAALCT